MGQADGVVDTCLNCGRGFDPNGILTSVPFGTFIAYDDKQGWIWRICGQCGTWNLLGREHSALALAEVRAAFNAGTLVLHDDSFSIAQPSKHSALLLLRAGPFDAGAAAVQRHLRTAAWRVEKSRLIRIAYLVAAAVLVVSLGWFAAALSLVGLVSGGKLVFDIRAARHGVKVPWWRLALHTILVAAGFVTVATRSSTSTLIVASLMLAGGCAVGFLAGPPTLAKLTRPDGSLRRITTDDLDHIGITWSGYTKEDFCITGLPHGDRLYGDEAAEALGVLVAAQESEGSLVDAAGLAHSFGGLGGILRCLEPVRQDQGGVLPIGGVAPRMLAALSFALHDGDNEQIMPFRGGIRDRLTEARAVAEIADELH